MLPTCEPTRLARTDAFIAVAWRTTITLMIVLVSALFFSGCITGPKRPPETRTPPWNPDPSQSPSKTTWDGKIPGTN